MVTISKLAQESTSIFDFSRSTNQQLHTLAHGEHDKSSRGWPSRSRDFASGSLLAGSQNWFGSAFTRAVLAHNASSFCFLRASAGNYSLSLCPLPKNLRNNFAVGETSRIVRHKASNETFTNRLSPSSKSTRQIPQILVAHGMLIRFSIHHVGCWVVLDSGNGVRALNPGGD
jgi:hypothetical protein